MTQFLNYPLILGSGSPRRKEILNFFKIPIIQITSNFNEDTIPFNGNPKTYVLKLAKKKAFSIREIHKENLILTADTIVYKEGKIYGKPKNFDEAIFYLSTLSNSWHDVYTGLVLCKNETYYCGLDRTKVLFNPFSEKDIIRYLNSIEWKDKAGAYAIQESGSILVKKIIGCYYNVMGLPMNVLRNLLSKVDIDLWDFL